MTAFSAETRAVLQQAGWSENRKVDTSEYEKCLKLKGYPVHAVVVDFLRQFGGLRVVHPHHRLRIDAFIPHRDKSFNVSESKVGLKKLEEAIASHPLAVREMAKQSEDLRFLKQAEKLNPDFVEWLCTSFDNDGKSLIDLA